MKRYYVIDFARFIASLLVICIHFNPFGNLYSPLTDSRFYSASNSTIFLSAVLARLAVPFFFITTGYFLSKTLIGQNKQKIKCYLIEIFKLGSCWLFIYFIIFYVMQRLQESVTFDVQMFVSAYVYHLWYLVALIVGTFICFKLLSCFSLRQCCVIAAALYVLGVLGDTYNGLVLMSPLKVIGDSYNMIFLTTRNGLFMAAPFVMLGVCLAYHPVKLSFKVLIVAFSLSLFCMSAEVIWLIKNQIPRDYNMNLILPIASIFLFELLLVCEEKVALFTVGKRVADYCGRLSLYIYLTHVLVIVIVCDILNVSSRYLAFFSVVLMTICVAAILLYIKEKFLSFKSA